MALSVIMTLKVAMLNLSNSPNISYCHYSISMQVEAVLGGEGVLPTVNQDLIITLTLTLTPILTLT